VNLYICEKPSLAKALFIGLGGNEILIRNQQKNGYFEIGDHSVTFCYGHMLELFDPEDHDIKYKNWNMDDLPFKFEPKYKVKIENKKQYTVIKNLIKKADCIINVGDADEEGQALIDEIIEFEGFKKQTKRILICDYNIDEVKKSISRISNNSNFVNNGLYSKARAISDQILGYNLTRAYTLAARKKGYDGVIPFGRVQTEIINLIDERCFSVNNHTETFYYNVNGSFEFNKIKFKARYVTKPTDKINEKKQLHDLEFSKQISEIIKNKSATIEKAKHNKKEKIAPMPYTMAALQSDCARKFGASAMDVLNAAQSLYETHKALTYPRTNCNYIPKNRFDDRFKTIETIIKSNGQFKKFSDIPKNSSVHKCFNDEKCDVHHGIIPTITPVDFSKLTELEAKIYNLVARSFMAIISPCSVYNTSDIDIKIADLQFSLKREALIFSGWEVLYSNDSDNPLLENDSDDEMGSGGVDELRVGMNGICVDSTIDKKQGQAPRFYVESTLLTNLIHIAKEIKDPELKTIMTDFFKDKGIPAELGTEATRAGLLEKIFQSGLVEKIKIKGYKEDAIVTTEIGRKMMAIIPTECKSVDMTAKWVKMGIDVKQGSMSVTEYVNNVYSDVSKYVRKIKSDGINLNLNLKKCPNCNDGLLKLIKTDSNSFFSCTNYPNCSTSFSEYKGLPFTDKFSCNSCGEPLILRKGKDEYYFGCSGYKKGCKSTMACVGGKPATKVFSKQSRSKNANAKRNSTVKSIGSISGGKK
jgi:DNA topoisomerase III